MISCPATGTRRGRQRTFYGWAVALFLCLLAAGCGRGYAGPQRGSVAGTVTVNGQPLANGSLRFVPAEGTTGPIAGAAVENGRYEIAEAKGPVVGTYRVEIEGVRRTGNKVRTPTGQAVDEYVTAVPAQYNTQSTLVCEIAAGENALSFELSGE